MDKDIFPDDGCLEELRNQRDILRSDLKSLNNQISIRTGLRYKSARPAIDLIRNDPVTASGDRLSGTKRARLEASDATVYSSDEDEPLRMRKNLKLTSVLAQPQVKFQSRAAEEERKALLERQRNDKQSLDRNKRMFGLLVGTLQRFRTEESGREQLTMKRSKIEEKLDVANEEEKASSNRETERLVKLRHQKEDLLEKTELKLDKISQFHNWEKTHIHLRGYIRTETKPKIFWIPKEHVPITQKKLKDTKDYFNLCIAERTAKFTKDMKDLELEVEKISQAIKLYE